jgi:hypothetical protein
MRVSKALMVLAAAGVLTACGGGGADAGTPPFADGSASAPTGGGGGGSTPTGPGGGISTVSNGVPSQRFMSISVEQYNLDWSFDGKTTSVQVFVADTAGNPVPDGSVIQFSTEGGQIITSCKTTGIKSGTTVISGCSVVFNTQDFRPFDGFARIIAWMVGNEAYKDLNANGQYDQGEPFIDSGRIFRDDDNSGTYNSSFDELVVDATLTAQPGIGTAACLLPTDRPNINEIPLSVQATCDGAWGSTLIRRTAVIPVSDPRFLVMEPVSEGVAVYSNTATPIPALQNRPAATLGTEVAVANAPTGCKITVTPDKVPNAVTTTVHQIRGVGTACSGQTVLVSATFEGRTATANYTLP